MLLDIARRRYLSANPDDLIADQLVDRRKLAMN